MGRGVDGYTVGFEFSFQDVLDSARDSEVPLKYPEEAEDFLRYHEDALSEAINTAFFVRVNELLPRWLKLSACKFCSSRNRYPKHSLHPSCCDEAITDYIKELEANIKAIEK